MTPAQKIIKHCAVALAIFIIVMIVAGVVRLIGGLAFLTAVKNGEVEETNEYELSVPDTTNRLDVELASISFAIKYGDTPTVKWSSKYVKVDIKNNTLVIKEKERWNLLSETPEDEQIIIYLPETFQFEEVDFESGAGVVYIEDLSAKKLEFELGAGDVEIDRLFSLKTSIDGGAGEITIKNGYLGKLDLDMGVGKLNLTASMEDNSSIDLGVGEANITLIGSENNYTLDINKGIGNITINGKSISKGRYGEGGNKIKLDGGIGSINIGFKQ